MDGAVAVITSSTKILEQFVENFRRGCVGIARFVRGVGRVQGIIWRPFGVVPASKGFCKKGEGAALVALYLLRAPKGEVRWVIKLGGMMLVAIISDSVSRYMLISVLTACTTMTSARQQGLSRDGYKLRCYTIRICHVLPSKMIIVFHLRFVVESHVILVRNKWHVG